MLCGICLLEQRGIGYLLRTSYINTMQLFINKKILLCGKKNASRYQRVTFSQKVKLTYAEKLFQNRVPQHLEKQSHQCYQPVRIISRHDCRCIHFSLGTE